MEDAPRIFAVHKQGCGTNHPQDHFAQPQDLRIATGGPLRDFLRLGHPWCEIQGVMCRSCNPLDIQQLSFPGDLWFVLVNPVFEAPTAEMRAVLPKQIAMSSAIHNCAMGGSLVFSLHHTIVATRRC